MEGRNWSSKFFPLRVDLYKLVKVKMTELLLLKEYSSILNWPRGYKTFSVLNSAEHEISNANKG